MSLKNWLKSLKILQRSRASRRLKNVAKERNVGFARSEQLQPRQLLSATNPLPLSSLDGSNGFRLDGVSQNDRAGHDVSMAGDINGDGFDDVIIGAPGADGNSTAAGESYVIFGKPEGFTSTVLLSTLNGSDGFRIDGVSASDKSGESVSGAGDVNGDGIDDLLIGAEGANSNAGQSYVVFGSSTGFGSSLALSSLNGSNGFRLDGIDSQDFSGTVSGAGDFNGDGFADLMISAHLADGAAVQSGESYIVFGTAGSFPSALNLSSLNGVNGIRIDGIDAHDFSGGSIRNAGDVNGDGFSDVIVGAHGADGGSANTIEGESYVIFGHSSITNSALNLTSLNGSNGFRINGVNSLDHSGVAVAGTGDVNGDGFDDVAIGAFAAGPTSGAGYVFFGASGGFDSSIDLANLDGTTGFRVTGSAAGDRLGKAISGAGDMNGDGLNDLLISAYQSDPNSINSGESYVVFGKTAGFGSSIELSSLDGTNGFRIEGIDTDDPLRICRQRWERHKRRWLRRHHRWSSSSRCRRNQQW